MVKSYGWWGGVVVAYVIIVSAPVQIIGFLYFKTWSELRAQDLGPVGTGDWGLGPGLDNLLKIN